MEAPTSILSETLVPQKPRKRGPAPTGKGTQIGVRLQPPELAALDTWIAAQPEKPTRPEALRRLAKKGLEGDGVAVRAIPLDPDA